MDLIYNYINGELVEAISKSYIDNFEPATGKVYSKIPDSDENDVALAVSSAQEAFTTWSRTTIKERAGLLYKISELIKKNHESLAIIESRDNGKPYKLAYQVDIPRASQNFEFYAGALLHKHDDAFHTDNETINYVHRTPIGVAGCISPWNLPLYLFSWKIAPALAAGCTVVAKPSEITPFSAFELSKICMEAGLPAGVLNIVHGVGNKVGSAIVSHPEVKAISFTGGTQTGEKISEIAAPKFKKLSLELGGKNPNIIFEDCDFDRMLSTTVHSSFANQGQICLCGSRILVQRSIYDKFKTSFIEKVGKLKVGDPNAEDTKVGAIVSKGHKEKILSYIELAKEEGGTILYGGKTVFVEGRCEEGYFVEPTIIEGLPQTCRTNQEEIFGPVVTVQPFDTIEEAIELANSTNYGLAATIWTQNLNTAHRVSHAIQSGIVWVNCWLVRDLRTPFGGMKNSGVGREGGFHAIDFFTEEKNICIKL